MVFLNLAMRSRSVQCTLGLPKGHFEHGICLKWNSGIWNVSFKKGRNTGHGPYNYEIRNTGPRKLPNFVMWEDRRYETGNMEHGHFETWIRESIQDPLGSPHTAWREFLSWHLYVPVWHWVWNSTYLASLDVMFMLFTNLSASVKMHAFKKTTPPPTTTTYGTSRVGYMQTRTPPCLERTFFQSRISTCTFCLRRDRPKHSALFPSSKVAPVVDAPVSLR